MRLKAQKFFPLVVVAAGLLAYHNSFSGSFFHDDFQAILDNPTVRQLWPIGPVLAPFRGSTSPVAGRPLINLSLAFNYAISGYNVWSYHAVKVPEAMEHWEQALRIKPDYAEAHYNLGVALERAGRVQEAIGHYEQATRLKPDFAEAQNSLARLQAVR